MCLTGHRASLFSLCFHGWGLSVPNYLSNSSSHTPVHQWLLQFPTSSPSQVNDKFQQLYLTTSIALSPTDLFSQPVLILTWSQCAWEFFQIECQTLIERSQSLQKTFSSLRARWRLTITLTHSGLNSLGAVNFRVWSVSWFGLSPSGFRSRKPGLFVTILTYHVQEHPKLICLQNILAVTFSAAPVEQFQMNFRKTCVCDD